MLRSVGGSDVGEEKDGSFLAAQVWVCEGVMETWAGTEVWVCGGVMGKWVGTEVWVWECECGWGSGWWVIEEVLEGESRPPYKSVAQEPGCNVQVTFICVRRIDLVRISLCDGLGQTARRSLAWPWKTVSTPDSKALSGLALEDL
eukprot:136200-Chlamydomonas_euryale.AAC.1